MGGHWDASGQRDACGQRGACEKVASAMGRRVQVRQLIMSVRRLFLRGSVGGYWGSLGVLGVLWGAGEVLGVPGSPGVLDVLELMSACASPLYRCCSSQVMLCCMGISSFPHSQSGQISGNPMGRQEDSWTSANTRKHSWPKVNAEMGLPQLSTAATNMQRRFGSGWLPPATPAPPLCPVSTPTQPISPPPR